MLLALLFVGGVDTDVAEDVLGVVFGRDKSTELAHAPNNVETVAIYTPKNKVEVREKRWMERWIGF